MISSKKTPPIAISKVVSGYAKPDITGTIEMAAVVRAQLA
jgi:hypothetical protein